MIPGNVINKLSDGTKKSTSIQFVLLILLFGVGIATVTNVQLNALGSISSLLAVFTTRVAQIMTNTIQKKYKVHVGETQGTLQFASRAKRITNCAQVNEILTEAALLKKCWNSRCVGGNGCNSISQH